MKAARRLLVTVFLAGALPASPVFSGDGLRMIAKKLDDNLNAKPAPSLAVLNFLYSRNRSSTGSYLVSERLVTYLVQSGSVVLERRLLDKLLEERKLWETGLAGPEAVKSVGKFLGADAVVTGFLTDLSDSATEVLVRVVKVDTGEIISSASGIIQRIWTDPPRLPKIAQPRSAVPVAFAPVPPAQEPSRSRLKETTLRLSGRGDRRRYFPAPVPFLMPSTAPSSQGRSSK